MNKSILMKLGLSLLVMTFTTSLGWSQETKAQKKIYTTTGGEVILSWADAKDNGADANSVLRFAPFFNFQNQLHVDMHDKLGFFTGLNIRNIGFIYDDPVEVNTRYKLRTYSLGIPFAVKVGTMQGTFVFVGYEIELPLNFKAKTFVNEDKVSKSSDWFSKRTPGLYQSLFVGVQAPYGLQVKFKYYMTNFVDKGYVANDGNGNAIYPYQNFEANVFYISLSFQLFKNASFYYDEILDQSGPNEH